ncbi:peptide chain release factor N(5)-glutamine methyltransferase [Furfurilactobacillus siliginis]|uniref:Release factor glutamine methyltransferase n=1 Tax=Furfurilactobacillus siliginis TaxID=348151 RepID=A0A0R2L4K5_9LACO|nr:peptide chain release factor N(5)-glutamine methyltransferase [Furfurilactobacillus siliginis]KRN96703.1 methylase of polypeptide chain release factor [Furfurilactobacillus siliginis]GEK29569.1 release factor glutamine methyltransferase [Furfurilactobacillus siliginis]
MANSTILEAQQWASSYFNDHLETSDPQLAELLMEDLFQWTRTEMLMNRRGELSDAQWKRYQQAVLAVAEGQPEQYVVGRAPFFGRSFQVTPAVLIPRPETEELVEWVLTDNPTDTMKSMLDIGTGSGVLAISLALERSTWQVTGTDISEAAIAVANQNADQLGAKVTWTTGDLFSGIGQQRYDVIVSNPPYISETERPLMDQSVLDFEPDLALFADNDGLAIYQRLANELAQHLTPQGCAYFEIGFAQGSAVVSLMKRALPEAEVTLKQDINGHDRMVRVQLVTGGAIA